MSLGSTKVTKTKLTPKQELFVLEYLKDFNAKQAAIRSGYDPEYAKKRGHYLLERADVQERVAEAFHRIAGKVEVNVEAILRELQIMAHFDPNDLYDENQCLRRIQDMPLNIRKNIASIECDEIWEYEGTGKNRVRTQVGITKKVKLWPKDRGVELLGKYLAMFVDRERHEGPNGEALPAVQVHIHKSGVTAIARPEVATNAPAPV